MSTTLVCVDADGVLFGERIGIPYSEVQQLLTQDVTGNFHPVTISTASGSANAQRIQAHSRNNSTFFAIYR